MSKALGIELCYYHFSGQCAGQVLVWGARKPAKMDSPDFLSSTHWGQMEGDQNLRIKIRQEGPRIMGVHTVFEDTYCSIGHGRSTRCEQQLSSSDRTKER